MNMIRSATLLVIFALSMGWAGQLRAETADEPKSGNDPFYFNFGQEKPAEEDKPKSILNPYDPKYRPVPQSLSASIGSVLSETDLRYDLLHSPSGKDGDIILRLTSPKMITGCLDKNATQVVDIAKENGALKIKVTHGPLLTDKATVRTSQYQCKIQNGNAATDIPLNRDTLVKDGIREISFISDSAGALLTLALDLTPERITLGKKHLRATANETITDKTTFWFYPEGTLILFSSLVDMNAPETLLAIRTMAQEKGLMPLDEHFMGFVPPKAQNALYVVDTKGRFKDKWNKADGIFSVGEIPRSETTYKPGGPYEKSVPQAIYARTPHMDE